MSPLKKILLMTLLPLSFQPMASEEKDNIDYMPEIHGVVRARYEADLNEDLSRFQVRNARVSVGGKIAPVISYFVQADLCNQGKMQFLDAWGRLNFTDELYLQAGQFRIPFGVDPFMSPANYIFNNRSFVGKQVNNNRGVGAKLGYTFSRIPLTLEGGAFNSSSIEDHKVWSKHLSCAFKATYKICNTTLSGGFQSISPYAVRINSSDIALGWKNSGLWLQGEYMFKHYCNTPQLDSTHAWVVFSDYSFPVKWGMFNRASVQARYDGMTDNSNGKPDSEGVITYSNAAANRITVGGTVTYTYKMVHADVRLNYENYFYHSGTTYPKEFDNIISAELVVRF